MEFLRYAVSLELRYVPVVVTVSLVLWVLVHCVYRLTLHPLASYPGPKLAALTTWYATLIASRGDLHKRIREWHEQYGPVLRLTPNALSFNHPRAYTDIYGFRANASKDERYAGLSVSRRTPSLITSTERDTTRLKRKVHAKFLGAQNLATLEPRVLRHVDGFVEVLGSGGEGKGGGGRDGWCEAVDVARVANWMTLDIISDLVFGSSASLLQNSKYRWFADAIATMSWRGVLHAFQPAIYKFRLERFAMAAWESSYRLMGALGTWAHKQSVKCADSESQVPAFIRTVRDSQDPKSGLAFREKDRWVESVLLLVAGSDTTSVTISAVLHYLLHHPSVHQRVAAEIRAAFSDAAEIKPGKDLDGCTFLTSCIKESLRLAPAVANFLPRLVHPGGAVIDGVPLGEGTTVGSSIYALHRNSQYFPEPDAFKPDRWMQKGEAKAVAEDGFHPFSAGPRMCVGAKLAWMEVTVTVAKALWVYEMRLAPGTTCCLSKKPGDLGCEFRLQTFATSVANGPMTQVRKRSRVVKGCDEGRLGSCGGILDEKIDC